MTQRIFGSPVSPQDAVLTLLGQRIKNTPYEGQVFVAGGFVRDYVLNKPSKDIDLVVTMDNGGIRFAEWVCQQLGIYKSGANPVIFPRFGTAKFNFRDIKVGEFDISDIDIECVMTRAESYIPGSRKPEVKYASLKDDAMRRDFTVNSLMMDVGNRNILDLTGMGLDDIREGVIRSAMDPNYIFAEDPLRMLRAIRFAVRFDWNLPNNMIDAIVSCADQIQNISEERISEEINKMLLAKRPSQAFRLMLHTGLLDYFLPELALLNGVNQNHYHVDDVFEHTMKVVDEFPVLGTPIVVTRLAALLHDIGKPQTRTVEEGSVHFYRHEEVGAEMAEQILRRLRYPMDTILSVRNVVYNHMRLKSGGPDGSKLTDKSLRRFMADLGQDWDIALSVMHADNMAHHPDHAMPLQIPILSQRISSMERAAPKKPSLPINGYDVMKALGIGPGPAIKDALAKVEDAWYENPNLTKDEALALIQA